VAGVTGHGPVELYIYWKLAPTRRDAALAAARALQSRLADQGIACRLLQRSDESAPGDGALTVMETYGAGAGLDRESADRVVQATQAALGAWALGPRHVERFAPCPPDAP
jgi:Domain of unknown function (DUF4936)